MQSSSVDPVRFAVIGLGHIAQAAVLPAFQNAENARLTALVSHDDEKLKHLGQRYGINELHHYDELESLLDRQIIDAVYLALPNHLHHEYTLRTARKGVHVLCEKPLAVTADQCRSMIQACHDNDVLLMTAYRLHFDAANLRAADIARSGDLGHLRFFNSTFSQNVVGEDIRLNPIEEGGGTLYDTGIYCINAARYLFGDEPTQVIAASERLDGDDRFSDCDEMTSVIMRFPNQRVASFLTSFGAHDIAHYRIAGTRGALELDRAYKYAEEMEMTLTSDGDVGHQRFPKRDQFGPQLVYFSECIRQNRRPEPDGYEGLIDVQIIEACYESARSGHPVDLDLPSPLERPDLDQVILRPSFDKPDEIHASSPSKPD